jgi:hypothetical protein
MIGRHVQCMLAVAVLLAVGIVQATQPQQLESIDSGIGQVRNQLMANGLGSDMTEEQQALLQHLQAETGLRGAQRKLQDKEDFGLPPGVAGFEAPKGVEVPVVPLAGSPDKPSIDVFSWAIAAKMEGKHSMLQQQLEL